jgi:hypothetical protein
MRHSKTTEHIIDVGIMVKFKSNMLRIEAYTSTSLRINSVVDDERKTQKINQKFLK